MAVATAVAACSTLPTPAPPPPARHRSPTPHPRRRPQSPAGGVRDRHAYEWLLRDLLALPGNPAVVILHSYRWWRAAGDGQTEGLFYMEPEPQLELFAHVGLKSHLLIRSRPAHHAHLTHLAYRPVLPCLALSGPAFAGHSAAQCRCLPAPHASLPSMLATLLSCLPLRRCALSTRSTRPAVPCAGCSALHAALAPTLPRSITTSPRSPCVRRPGTSCELASTASRWGFKRGWAGKRAALPLPTVLGLHGRHALAGSCAGATACTWPPPPDLDGGGLPSGGVTPPVSH